jgi:hypothetical protein
MSDMLFNAKIMVDDKDVIYHVDEIKYKDSDEKLMGNIAYNEEKTNKFIIPVNSLRSYADRTPSTLEKLCTKLVDDEKKVHKLWLGKYRSKPKTGEEILVDTSLTYLCDLMKSQPDSVNLYLYSTSGSGKVLNISYAKNKASAESAFRSRRRGSKSVKRRRKLVSKSKSRKRSSKPRRR